MFAVCWLSLVLPISSLSSANPHQPQTLTWQLIDVDTGETVNSTQTLAPLGTWWPDLDFCLRQINPSVRSIPPNIAQAYGFYSCPGEGKK